MNDDLDPSSSDNGTNSDSDMITILIIKLKHILITIKG